VPVIARLSKRFYDVVGEDVAGELVDWLNAVEQDLTDRARFRQLNELNFARLDARLEQHVAEFRLGRPGEIGGLRGELRKEIPSLRGEILGLGVEFRAELHRVRNELLCWMFGFWVTNLLGVAGLLILLRGQ
jgi:hypothetical protein